MRVPVYVVVVHKIKQLTALQIREKYARWVKYGYRTLVKANGEVPGAGEGLSPGGENNFRQRRAGRTSLARRRWMPAKGLASGGGEESETRIHPTLDVRTTDGVPTQAHKNGHRREKNTSKPKEAEFLCEM